MSSVHNQSQADRVIVELKPVSVLEVEGDWNVLQAILATLSETNISWICFGNFITGSASNTTYLLEVFSSHASTNHAREQEVSVKMTSIYITTHPSRIEGKIFTSKSKFQAKYVALIAIESWSCKYFFLLMKTMLRNISAVASLAQ